MAQGVELKERPGGRGEGDDERGTGVEAPRECTRVGGSKGGRVGARNGAGS